MSCPGMYSSSLLCSFFFGRWLKSMSENIKKHEKSRDLKFEILVEKDLKISVQG